MRNVILLVVRLVSNSDVRLCMNLSLLDLQFTYFY